MTKLVYCLCRKAGLSREEFIRWFDDLAAVFEARESPEWGASTADETNFVDPRRSAYFVSEERQIL